MEYDREFLTGTVGVLILTLLSERAMYGYEMVQEAERRSDQTFQLKEGTVYPALHQMERAGLLKASLARQRGGASAQVLQPHGERAAAGGVQTASVDDHLRRDACHPRRRPCVSAIASKR